MMITLIMSLSGISLFSYYTIQRYNFDPVSVTVDTEYINWNSSFPAVSICLVKGKNTQTLKPLIDKLNISYKGSRTNFLRNVHSCMFASISRLELSLLQKCEELQTMHDINIEELIDKLFPYDCNKFLDFLYYDNELIYNCSDFLEYHKTELGYCFIANSIIDYGYSFDRLKLKYNFFSKNKKLSMRLKASNLWQYTIHFHSPEDMPFFNSILKEVVATNTIYSYNVDNIVTDTEASLKSIRQRGCRFPHEKLNGSPYHYRQSEIGSKNDINYSDISIEVLNTPSARYKRSVTRSKLDLAVSIAGLAGLFFGASVLNLVQIIYQSVAVKN